MENPNFAVQPDNDEALPSYPSNPLNLEGYKNIGFCLPEQNGYTLSNDLDRIQPVFHESSSLTKEEAKEVLAVFVSEHCCYGKGPLKNLDIIDMKSSNTYRYILESFTETRSTKYAYEPYLQQIIVNTGTAPPHPWQIPVTPNQPFFDQKVLIEIPNTAHVEICKKCNGGGRRTCFGCGGRGTKSCFHCNGSGHKHNHQNNHRERCFFCHGSGYSACSSCSRTGYIICKICTGSGRLKWFLQLTVEFKNNKDDYFSKTEFIPDELLRSCLAKNTFSDSNYRVFPISNHPNQYINQASSNLLNQHYNQFTQSKILSQRHEINTIPITLVTYSWKEKIHTYIIYGLENRVYAPDYPQKCCCTIL